MTGESCRGPWAGPRDMLLILAHSKEGNVRKLTPDLRKKDVKVNEFFWSIIHNSVHVDELM